MKTSWLFRFIRQKSFKSTYKFFWHYFQLPEIDLLQIIHEFHPVDPIAKELVWMPPFKGSTHDDFSILINLITYYKPQLILEIGTGFGATTANICANSDSKIYTVNALPEQIQGKVITYSLAENKIGSVYKELGFGHRVNQIFSNTEDIDFLDYLHPNSVDFVIIDGCHDPDFVVNDFLKTLPVLSDKAIVVFHDVHPSCDMHLVDAYSGCLYLRKKNGYNIQHITNSWWGILKIQKPSHNISTSQSWFNSLFTMTMSQKKILLFHKTNAKRLHWILRLFRRIRTLVEA